MIDIQETVDSIREFLEENRRLTIIVCSGLIVILILISILMMVSPSSKKNRTPVSRTLVLTEPLLLPEAPVVPDGYITSRITQKNWPDEELEPWFPLPDAAEVEKLGEANDRIINEIIGAAP